MSLNKVMIIGNLGSDPETHQFSNGGNVTNISVATSEQWVDKEGQKQESTEWHRVALFNRLGEIAAQYLRKGSKVYIEGSIHTRKWKDQSGQDRYSTEIRASSMRMLDSKGEHTPQQPQQPMQQPQQQQAQQMQQMQQPMQQQRPVEVDDSEIPFT